MIDLKTIKKIETRQRFVAFGLPAILIGIAFLLFSLGAKLISSLETKKTDLSTKQQQAIETLQFNQFLSENSSRLEQIDYIIPDESMMIAVVSDFESVLKSFDPQSKVKIASTNPIKVDTSLSINLVILFSAPMENLVPILEKIQQLPYMFQLLSLETNQIGDSYSHQLSLRLYVQDPFSNH